MFCFNKPILGLKEAISTTFEEAGVEDWKEKMAAMMAPVAEFDLTPAVNRWFERNRSKGERARRPHFLN